MTRNCGFGVFVSPAQKAVHVEKLHTWAFREVEEIERGKVTTPWFLIFSGNEEAAREIAAAWQNRRNQGLL